MIGSNEGGNLNVLMFEVGMLQRDPATGAETARTLAVHPMLTAPKTIRYRDSSRTSVTQTVGGALETKAGRALRQVSLDGQWGVAERGFGTLIGTGEYRHSRFYGEVVRLGEALYRADVDDALRAVATSPFVRAGVASFDPRTTLFYVNFYDFWNGVAFECNIPSYEFERRADGAGASGMIHYRLTLQEIGPIITSGVGEQLLAPLFQGFRLWDDLNEVLESYDTDSLTDAIVSVPAGVVAELAESLEGFRSGIDSVTALMGAAPRPTPDGATVAFFGAVDRIRQAANGSATAVGLYATGDLAEEQGQIAWTTAPQEGLIRGLELYSLQEDLADVEDAAAWQTAAGSLFGMSQRNYQSWVASQGSVSQAGPNIAGSSHHTVTELDDETSISTLWGVDWDTILAANDLTPDEALWPGTVLDIPIVRASGPQPIDGLPTFGRHLGQDAWGTDLAADLAVDGGAPVVLSGADVIEQGCSYLLGEFGPALLRDLGDVPPVVRTPFIRERLRILFASDRRLLDLQEVTVTESGAGLDISVSVATINGGTVRGGTG